MHTYTYLALGDSYTIGEAVLLKENFPYQVVQLLRQYGKYCAAPEIIAKTGWTTDELEEGMKGYAFLPRYDCVSLLIGVNNQYRGRDIQVYKMEFEALLQKAIAFAGGKPSHVVVVSIPDYSVTTFAQDKDPAKIAREVDIFNNINRAVSIQYKVTYIDITAGSRAAQHDPELLAPDGLHPSAKEYARWAEAVAKAFRALLP